MRPVTTLLCIIAFACLALAMERHQAALFTRRLSPTQTRALRLAGWSALVSTAWIVIAAQGWALGLVVFCGLMSVSAGLVYGAMIVYERVRRPDAA